MATQEDVLDFVLSGKQDTPVLITAGAGRGKSYLLRQITEAVGSSLVVAAPTGIAALNIGGETMHSLFGLPTSLVTREDKEKISRKTRDIFKRVDTIALDECGMVRADYLDLIDYKLKNIRKSKLPFGGINFIAIGDFFQLSPVITNNEKKHFIHDSPFCFDSDVWRESQFKVFELTKCYRQEEPRQVKILDSIRQKDVNYKRAIEEINKMAKPESDEDSITLVCYKRDADMINSYRYNQMSGEEYVYRAETKNRFYEKPVEDVLRLKVGVRVIIRANDQVNGFYKNGEQGVVQSCNADYVIVEKDNGETVAVTHFTWEKYSYESTTEGLTKKVVATYKQIPLRLGYGITIHSCQGMTLDDVHLDLGMGTFSDGQLYTSLSRIRDLRDMSLARSLIASDLKVNQRVIDFYKGLRGVKTDA